MSATEPHSTKKLYWDDPFATTFEAEARASTFQGRPSIVLDRTLFYPEAGGQLADRGKLVSANAEGTSIEIPIVDVQIDDAGIIHHLYDNEGAERLARTSGVRGEIDSERRRDHMAQHTAQHMLSQALVEMARADTVSARLGTTSCTIDIDVPNVHESALARAEDRVNGVIRDDVVVRQLFPTDEELASLTLRRTPKVTQGIRIIEVEGFDRTPCGGTHCTRTGQIGVVRVVGLERYKGKIRVMFHAASRAVSDMREKDRALTSLARELTCGPLDVGGAVGKLRAELKARTDALSSVRSELVGLVADRALAEHPAGEGDTVIALLREGDDLATLRALSGRLAARADVIALAASVDRDTQDLLVVVQRGSRPSFDCGAWFKATAKTLGGRGGGNKERAEGRLSYGAYGPEGRFEEVAKSLTLVQNAATAI